MRRPVLVLLAAALVAVAPAPAASPLAAPTVVPIAREGGHLFAEISVDGTPLHVVVDTGGGEIIDAAVAKRLRLAERGRILVEGVGNGRDAASATTVATLTIGAATLHDVPFTVLPIADSFGVAEAAHVDGMIGPEVLGRFVVTIDAAAGRMTLAPPTTPVDGPTIPLAFAAGEHPRVPCIVAAVPTTCAIDTGSRLAATLLRPFLSAHPAVAALATTADGVDGYGIGGPARGRLGVVPISLAGESLHVVADFTTQRRGAFAVEHVGANLGNGVLDKFVVTLYPRARRAKFVPSPLFDAPQDLDRSGIFLIRHGDGIEALDVRPATPAAAAGISDGDTIVAVDGAPAATLGLAGIRAALRGPAGTTVQLTVRGGDGAERTVALVLSDYASQPATVGLG